MPIATVGAPPEKGFAARSWTSTVPCSGILPESFASYKLDVAANGENLASFFAVEPAKSFAVIGKVRRIIEVECPRVSRTKIVLIRFPQQVTHRAPNLSDLTCTVLVSCRGRIATYGSI